MNNETNNDLGLMEHIILRKLSQVQVKLFDEPLHSDKELSRTEVEVLKGQMNILCELFHTKSKLEVN
jgi:hypothetical protein